MGGRSWARIYTLRIAERLGDGATVATIIVDSGLRYLSTDVFRLSTCVASPQDHSRNPANGPQADASNLEHCGGIYPTPARLATLQIPVFTLFFTTKRSDPANERPHCSTQGKRNGRCVRSDPLDCGNGRVGSQNHDSQPLPRESKHNQCDDDVEANDCASHGEI